MKANKAVFLARDGTLIVDTGYPRDPNRVAWIDGAPDALRFFESRGYALIVVSNQWRIGRGIVEPADTLAVAKRFQEILMAEGIELRAYYCLHAPDEGCGCRKPQPGMLLEAAKQLRLDLANSITIGDEESDIAAGKAAGTRTLRFHETSWKELLASWPFE